jgi:2',3'-cyclic-nucleotide 2'-phosphodiesterase/3'-nucleotidase
MRIKTRWFAAVLLWALAVQAEAVTITVLATTDLHGNLYPYDYYTAKPAQRGLAKIATLIREARRENPASILIDCGDTIQGSPLESVYQNFIRTGKLPAGMHAPQAPLPNRDPMMLAMKHWATGLVLGNHEFNFGLKELAGPRRQTLVLRTPWSAGSLQTVRALDLIRWRGEGHRRHHYPSIRLKPPHSTRTCASPTGRRRPSPPSGKRAGSISPIW